MYIFINPFLIHSLVKEGYDCSHSFPYCAIGRSGQHRQVIDEVSCPWTNDWERWSWAFNGQPSSYKSTLPMTRKKQEPGSPHTHSLQPHLEATEATEQHFSITKVWDRSTSHSNSDEHWPGLKRSENSYTHAPRRKRTKKGSNKKQVRSLLLPLGSL